MRLAAYAPDMLQHMLPISRRRRTVMAMQRELRLTRTSKLVLEALIDGIEDDLWGLKICGATGLTSGTVYPILSRLEDLGWVKTRWETDDDSPTRTTGPRRRFYTLTPDGLAAAHTVLAALAPKGKYGFALPSLHRALLRLAAVGGA
jgi:PadR family transcriptional regulator PadR